MKRVTIKTWKISDGERPINGAMPETVGEGEKIADSIRMFLGG
jgi:hypothetical protein